MLNILHADVTECNPTTEGFEYLGYVAETVNGRECQAWSAQSPHSHSYTNTSLYPDESVADASNYCRNPSHATGLWCYTTDPSVRWEACDVPSCNDSIGGEY